MPLLDYAGTLRAGQSLVPDFRLQKMQDEQFAFQREEMQMRRDEMERRRAAAERAEQQQIEFRQRMEQVMGGGGRPDDVTRLMLDFPEMAEAYKPVLERMDAEQKESDITATGSIYSRLNAGDTSGAASLLRQRVEADRAAGVEDPQDIALLQALESGDETEVKVAKSMIGMHLAAMTGVETFKSIYGGDEATTGVQREYDWRVNQFGKAAADSWLATQDTKLVPVVDGGQVFAYGPTGGNAPPVNAEGGDQSVAAGIPQNGPIGPWIEQAAGITASSRKRATGVPGTYHADDNARDFPTPTIAENVREGRRLKALFGPDFDVIYSENDKTGRHNDHVHVEPGPRLGAQIRGGGARGGPVKVASKQQYDRLPSGAEYIAPDGSRRRKP